MLVQRIYYFVFILAIVFLFYRKKHYLTWLPIIYIILDSSFSYFLTLSVVTYLRPVYFSILLIFFLREIKYNSVTGPLYIFLMYTMFLAIFSQEFFYSVKGYMQVFISMMAFPLGLIYFNNILKIDHLNKSILLLIVFSVIVTAVGYLFDIGKSFDYDRKTSLQTIGLLGSGGMYPAAFAIGILPFLQTSFKKPGLRWILYVSAIICYIFILLNMRRTAILIPVVGLLTFAWFIPNKKKIISVIILLTGVIVMLSPFYKDTLISRFEVREGKGRFEPDFYKTEGRFIENVEVFSQAFSFKDPVRSLVGHNIYASGRGEKEYRMYHSDSASLLAGAGIIGMILYLLFYIRLFRLSRYLKNSVLHDRKIFQTTYLSILFMSIFISLNGSMTLVTIRTIIFLYLGAIISFVLRNNTLLANQTIKAT